jgi:hypothetical protein
VQLARAISLASWPVGAGANITCKYFLCSDEQNDARGDPSVDLAVWLNPIGTEACLWVVSRAWLACDDRVGIVALFAISPHGRSRKCTNITTRRRNHPLAIGFRFGPCRSRVDEAPLIGYGTGSIREVFCRQGSQTASNPTTGSLRSRSSSVLSASSYSCNVGGPLAAVRAGTAGWIGLVVVTQNFVSSLFHSHLFDFTQCVNLRIWGWHRRRYVEGVFIAEPIPRVPDHDRGGIR